jgi:hypothetical protein
MARLASVLAVLAVGAVVVPDMTRASVTATDPWPAAARSTAGTVAARWAATVRPTAQLGAEPPGSCRRLDGRHAACPIAIVVLARDALSRRPWRCSATVLVARAGDGLAGRRTDTRCAPFPAPAAVPDPAAALGTAAALHANGDIACLPASDGRVTCVMRYAKGCIAAASVPLGRPGRGVALGAPVCRVLRTGRGF